MWRLLIGIVGLAAVSMALDPYTKEIQAWQTERDARLRAPDGWLTLVGLFWLKQGDNSIGSDPGNDFVLPKGSAPPHIGALRLSGKSILFEKPGQSPRKLAVDDEKPDVVTAGSVSFYIIQRQGRYAVRVKDSASPVLKRFHGMSYFPVNRAFRFNAKFIPDAKKIPILNILGKTDLEESPGVVEFSHQGHAYRLRPIFEDKTLFFLFKDSTNRHDTYQAGRMLNTPLPVNGRVDLDFNRAYNPPCTFTPYATCPLPPKENTLPFAVDAGEKRYGKGHAE